MTTVFVHPDSKKLTVVWSAIFETLPGWNFLIVQFDLLNIPADRSDFESYRYRNWIVLYFRKLLYKNIFIKFIFYWYQLEWFKSLIGIHFYNTKFFNKFCTKNFSTTFVQKIFKKQNFQEKFYVKQTSCYRSLKILC